MATAGEPILSCIWSTSVASMVQRPGSRHRVLAICHPQRVERSMVLGGSSCDRARCRKLARHRRSPLPPSLLVVRLAPRCLAVGVAGGPLSRGDNAALSGHWRWRCTVHGRWSVAEKRRRVFPFDARYEPLALGRPEVVVYWLNRNNSRPYRIAMGQTTAQLRPERQDMRPGARLLLREVQALPGRPN